MASKISICIKISGNVSSTSKGLRFVDITSIKGFFKEYDIIVSELHNGIIYYISNLTMKCSIQSSNQKVNSYYSSLFCKTFQLAINSATILNPVLSKLYEASDLNTKVTDRPVDSIGPGMLSPQSLSPNISDSELFPSRISIQSYWHDESEWRLKSTKLIDTLPSNVSVTWQRLVSPYVNGYPGDVIVVPGIVISS